MPMNTIHILTLPNGFFGRAEQGWKTLNIIKVKKILESYGYTVKIGEITKALDLEISPDDFVLYTSSDEQNIRNHIKDTVYFLSKKCKIIPNYEALLAHENKGFQQLWRNEKKICTLSGGYFFDHAELPRKYPYVYKSVTGAGSSGVRLIKNDASRKKTLRKEFKVSIIRKIIKIFKKFKITKDEYLQYLYRHKGFNLGVWQEFIEGLNCDYKVLIYGKKYYTLTRDVRKNDFRASGSGSFHYTAAMPEVLDYARKVFLSLDVPFASLDIAEKDGKCYLIEYQCMHFGPYTTINSKGFYNKTELGDWTYILETPDLELNTAESVHDYIKGTME